MTTSSKKVILFFLLIAFTQLVKGQVKIGDNPTQINKSSLLELESANKGLLFPRVSLTSTTAWGLADNTTPIAGMVVYNTRTTAAGFSGSATYPVAAGDGTGIYYWDFNKANITPDAAKELDRLVQFMKTNPTVWIEISSHTDSRGNDQFNLNLSQRRANAAVAYIVSKGIDKSRITARGYGETKPINKCTNGVKCSEEEYRLNRRTEFKVTKK